VVEIRIPKPGQAITSGELVEYLVADGAFVAAGEPIYMLATDKVEMEVEAPAAGIFRHRADVGGEYPVGHLVAVIEPSDA
jgi:pyruvate/2-oxoglutarate dehydrogenase complex dihydrolipoamide acyltransferase (E2) component